ncbi:MAG: hypothetical protein WCO96_01280 [Actinomycetes bacterium]|jgi:hypothetical protein
MSDVIEGESVELAHVEAQPLVAGNTPAETLEGHVLIANELRRIIAEQKLSVQVQGKEHVKVEGWQTLGLLCSITAVVTDTVPVDGGFMATVEARRVTDGMVVGRAQALCTNDEKKGPWKNADRYALLSMAQTRATSKALKQAVGPLMQLAGYQTTPLEEMPVEPVGEPVKRRCITEDQAKALTNLARIKSLSTPELRKLVAKEMQVPVEKARLLDLSPGEFESIMRTLELRP